MIYMWEYISYLGDGIIYEYIVLFIIAWWGPVVGYNIRAIYAAQGTAMTAIKMILHDPRPYMSDDRITV